MQRALDVNVKLKMSQWPSHIPFDVMGNIIFFLTDLDVDKPKLYPALKLDVMSLPAESGEKP